jgi:uncharacterized protein YjiS (DUF1127 family)
VYHRAIIRALYVSYTIHIQEKKMLRSLIDHFRKKIAYRKTYEELSKLTSRELYDLGIDRSMISRIAYETTYGVGNSNA